MDRDESEHILDPALQEALLAQRHQLEQQFDTAFQNMQQTLAAQINTLQTTIDQLQQQPPPPPAAAPTIAQVSHRIEGSPPSAFNGDRTLGRIWMDQVSLYLAANTWSSDEHKIKHVLTFFKEGRALTWATDASNYSAIHGHYPWVSFLAFRQAFLKEFSDPNDVARCISMLNHTMSWYQGSRSIDAYIDGFADLVKRANYVDEQGIPHLNLEGHVCLLFRTGLSSDIRHHCAVVQRPTPSTLADWKSSALAYVSAKSANDVIVEMTKMHLRPGPTPHRVFAPRPPAAPVAPAPVFAPPRPAVGPTPVAQPTLPKGHGDPMDVDAIQRQRRRLAALARIQCYNCHKHGHLSRDCPDRRHELRALDDEGNWVLSETELAQVEEFKNNLALEQDADVLNAAASDEVSEDFGTRRM